MTREEETEFVRVIGKAVGDAEVKTLRAIARAVAGELKPLREKVAELEKRQADAMHFRGVFEHGEKYQRGDCATHGGGLWFCRRAIDGAQGKPGSDTAGDAWRLTSKTR